MSRMISYINHSLHITLGDGREMVGKLLAFDKHMNVVLSDVSETRVLTKKQQDAGNTDATRKLGLILLRGEHIVSVRATEAQQEVSDKVPKPATESSAKAARGKIASSA